MNIAFSPISLGLASPENLQGESFVEATGRRLVQTESTGLPVVFVDTLVDENDGDLSGGDVSLREALALVEAGGTIEFAEDLAGTIALDSSLGQLVIDKALTIDGTGEAVITVDAQGNSRVFRISDGDYGTQLSVNIRGLTITGGNAGERFNADGGGIHTTENLDLTNVTITGNTAFDGGGIFG
ncbi:MAG: hypothetical protein AAFQ89_16265, partial [Cyanobacteria bacterium J06626_18]